MCNGYVQPHDWRSADVPPLSGQYIPAVQRVSADPYVMSPPSQYVPGEQYTQSLAAAE